MNVVIDADTGTDDAIALIMAINSPELQIDSVTTVAGNARLAHTTRNTLRLLSHLGRPRHSNLQRRRQTLQSQIKLRVPLPRAGRPDDPFADH